MKKIFVLATILAVVCGCARGVAPAKSEDQSALIFSRFERLKVGESKIADVRSLLGEPKSVSTMNDQTVIWIFRDNDKSIERAVISFSRQGVLTDKSWTPSETEPERVIQNLLKRFSSSDFKKQKVIQDFGHFFTTNVSLVDKRAGISIVLSQDGKEAVSISWSDPSVRSVAESMAKGNKSFRDPVTGLVTKSQE